MLVFGVSAHTQNVCISALGFCRRPPAGGLGPHGPGPNSQNRFKLGRPRHDRHGDALGDGCNGMVGDVRRYLEMFYGECMRLFYSVLFLVFTVFTYFSFWHFSSPFLWVLGLVSADNGCGSLTMIFIYISILWFNRMFLDDDFLGMGGTQCIPALPIQ